RRRGGSRRPRLDVLADQARRHRRPVVRDSGHAARSIVRVLLDGARRPASAVGLQGAPQVPDALHHLDRHRHRRRPRRIAAHVSGSRRPGFDLGTLLGVVSRAQLYFAKQRLARDPSAWWQALGAGLPAWYVWGLLSLVVVWLARRFRVGRASFGRYFFIHLGASRDVALLQLV